MLSRLQRTPALGSLWEVNLSPAEKTAPLGAEPWESQVNYSNKGFHFTPATKELCSKHRFFWQPDNWGLRGIFESVKRAAVSQQYVLVRLSCYTECGLSHATSSNGKFAFRTLGIIRNLAHDQALWALSHNKTTSLQENTWPTSLRKQSHSRDPSSRVFWSLLECFPSPRTQCLALFLLLFVHHLVSSFVIP